MNKEIKDFFSKLPSRTELTNRDYFAGLAMQSLMLEAAKKPGMFESTLDIAEEAYEYADAMIEAREK